MAAPHNLGPDSASRRVFLRRGSALSLAASAAPWALALSSMGDAAAQTAQDYKALVCIFLQGGNDAWNTVVPYDATHHALYQGLRSNLAYSRDALTSAVLKPSTAPTDGRQFALAPTLATGLLPLFDQGRLAVLHNVGTLVQPTSKAEYQARSVPLPPKLFSHNDQQSYWQASSAEGAVRGWGGRLGDLAMASNTTSTFTCINVAGNAVFLSGDTAVPYQVTPSGPIPVNGARGWLFGSAEACQALRQLMMGASPHLLANEHARVAKRSIESGELVSSALAAAQVPTTFPTGSPLADQLALVARMIASRQALGAKRQVFFVSIGGFDTHDSQQAVHPGLLGQVGAAMAAFYQATVALGVDSQVTAFTASDFGRTLVSNNDGSDHGWGAAHFALGGAVLGGRFVGPAPVPGNNGPDDVGQGRLLPALAVEQYAGTLARWFGVPASDLPLVLPRLSRFSEQDLGFMRV
ncbi:MAG: DUF1501 domain-containing protein [Giesbergeria sp.]